MIKKFLMISIYMMIGFQAHSAFQPNSLLRTIASEREVSTKTLKNICMIQVGDVGTLKYKGSSYEDAFSKVTDECFQRRTNLYVQSRKEQPDQDRQIQFAESCVNSIKCI